METGRIKELFHSVEADTAINLFLPILDNLPLDVCLKDAASLRYVFRNRYGAELFGCSQSACIGLTSRDILPSAMADWCEAMDKEALAHARTSVAEQLVIRKDGRERLLRARKFTINGLNGLPSLIVGISEDITEHRTALKNLQASEELLRDTNSKLKQQKLASFEDHVRAHQLVQTHATERRRLEDLATLRQSEVERVGRINLLGEMAAGLAHEINQPLAAIIYTLTGAANRAKTGALNNAQMLNVLQTAISQAHRSADILNRIRDMANKHTSYRNSVQINKVITELIALCIATGAGDAVKLRCEPDPRVPEVQADKVQIEQVLINLIRNGTEAAVETRAKNLEVVVRTAVLDENTIEVSVEDTGAGSSQECIARMFEPFYTTKEHGMGLGLAICLSIVEEHGGALRAENRREGGLRVSFTLPIRERA